MIPPRKKPRIVNPGDGRGRTKDGRERWLIYWYAEDGRERMKTCYSFTEAVDEADRIYAARKKALAAEAPTGDAAMTVAEAFTRYLDATVRKRSHRQDELTAAHLKSHFGAETRLRTLTAGRIAAYQEQRLAAGSVRRKTPEGTPAPLSAASINRPLALLRRVLRLACHRWGVLEAIPRIDLEREPQGRLRWLEADEAVRLLDACKASAHPSLFALVTVALETGLRKGELLGLAWDRVDFSRNVLRLEVTKSGKRREVPMRQAVYTVLSALPEPHEGRVFRAAKVRMAFESAVKTAKLNAPFRFHDLRHTFASWFVMDGGTVQELQQILGHATITMTMRYAHLSPGHLQAAMERTARVPDTMIQTPTQTEPTDRKSTPVPK